MKRLSKIFQRSSPGASPLEGTPSTDDLSEGFGKRFVIMGVNRNDMPLQTSKPFEDCWLDVSVAGIRIIDREEQLLAEFALTKINIYEVVNRNTSEPSFRFTYYAGVDFDTYTFKSPQSEGIYNTFKEAIQKLIKDENARSEHVQ